MAEGNGIRQFFRLIFDRESAERVKRDTQRALGEATDSRPVERQTGRIGRAMEGIGKIARRLGPIITAAFSVRALIRFGNQVEESRRRLVRMTGASGAALRGLQADTRAVFRGVPESLGEVSTAIGTLNTLLGLTGPALQRTTRAALSFARVNEVDVAQSAELVGQLINRFNLEAADAEGLMDRLTLAGQATGASVTGLANNLLQAGPALDALGFSLNQQIALMSELERRGISASDVTRRLALTLSRFAEGGARDAGEAWQMLVEGIQQAETDMEAISLATEAFGSRGAALALDIRAGVLEIEELTKQLSEADGTLRDTEASSRTAGQALKELGNTILSDLTPAINAGTNAFRWLVDFLRGTYETVVRTATNLVAGLVLGWQAAHSAILRLRITVNRALRRDTTELEASLRQVREQIRVTRETIWLINNDVDDMADGALRSGDAFARQREQAEGTREATEGSAEAVRDEVRELARGLELRTLTGQELLRAVELEGQIRDRLREGNLALEERNRLAEQLRALAPVTARVQPEIQAPTMPAGGGLMEVNIGRVDDGGRGALERQKAFVDDYAQHWQDQNRAILQAGQAAAWGVQRAWGMAFESMFTEGAAVGTFFEGLMRGMAGAGFQALEEYASAKVAQNLAEAAEQFARALGWSFLNPAQAAASKASAAQHLAAAGLWAAIGGGAGAAGRAVTGSRAGMTGGLSRGERDPMRGPQNIGPDIHIHIDGVDPRNPRHQRLIGETDRFYRERYGGRIRVKGGGN
jgi:TP901 family phage tail tape measure protein